MTTVLNAYSVAFPLITNRIQASVTNEGDTAIIASIIDTTVGHPARKWTFAGLPRQNYEFSLDEIDAGGAVVNNLANFSVVPGEIDGTLVRDDEQIQVDVTPGISSGTNTFTLDGTETFAGSGIFKKDYRGWEIVVMEYGGRAPLINGVDFSWDKTTAIFTLLATGDNLSNGQWYNIHFNDITDPTAGNSYPSISDFSINLVTADKIIDASYFGSKLLVQPAGNYLEVTLPDITTVPIGRPMMIEGRNTGSMWCAKFISANTISFWHGSLYLLPDESLRIYRYKKPDLSNEWRIDQMDGNFKTVGNEVASDKVNTDIMNCYPLDGSIGDVKTYARLFNEFVLHLPLSEVVNFDDWTSSDRTKFSLDNSIISTGYFYFPDRRDMFQKNNSATGVPGTYKSGQVGEQTFTLGIQTGDSFTGHPYDPTALGKGILANTPKTVNQSFTINTGKENYPKHYLTNKYCLL